MNRTSLESSHPEFRVGVVVIDADRREVHIQGSAEGFTDLAQRCEHAAHAVGIPSFVESIGPDLELPTPKGSCTLRFAGTAAVITGCSSALTELGRLAADFVAFNDIDEPGMHAHLDARTSSGEAWQVVLIGPRGDEDPGPDPASTPN